MPLDLRHLVQAQNDIEEALRRHRDREAARIMCNEFKWLLNSNRSIWEPVGEFARKLEAETLEQKTERRAAERQLLQTLATFVDKEQTIFEKFRVPPEKSAPVMDRVYSSLNVSSELPDLTPAALSQLRTNLAEAQELVCAHATTFMQRFGKGAARVVQSKAARVLAGAAVAGANVLIAVHDGGAVSSLSVKAGGIVMKGDIDGLADLLKEVLT
jgi:hypothetical protein